MRIERRKLSHNKQRDQVVTTLNAEFLREIGIDPDSRINVIYEDLHNIAILSAEENLSHILDIRTVVRDTTCPECGSINLDKKCQKCNINYDDQKG